ncbi:MAG: hypothetical protein SGILL_005033 [Bacillariaceae sp.]
MTPPKEKGDAAAQAATSRRLARNAYRLGKELTPDQHRELIDFSVPAKLIEPFDGTIKQARLSMSGTVDELPFQDGPGVLYGLPEATVDFWEGKEGASPTQMWEVVACPVVDVEGYYLNPARCLVGDTANIPDLFFDFVRGFSEDVVLDLLVNTTIPLVTGIITAITDQAALNDIISPACDLIGLIEDGFGFVDDILKELPKIQTFLEATIAPGIKFVENAVKGVKVVTDRIEKDFQPVIDFFAALAPDEVGRMLMQDGLDVYKDCAGHGTPCDEDMNESPFSCYQPIPQVDGVCLPLIIVESIDDGQIPEDFVQVLNAGMLSKKVESTLDDQALRGFEAAFGVSDGLSIAKIVLDSLKETKEELKSDIQELGKDVMTGISAAEKSFANDVKEQCSSNTSPKADEGDTPKRRLRMDSSKLKESEGYQKAKDTASSFGMDESELLKMFDKFVDAFSDESIIPSESALKKEMAKALEGTDFATELKATVESQKSTILDDITKATLLETFGGGGSARRVLNPTISLKTICNNLIDTVTGTIEQLATKLVKDLLLSKDVMQKLFDASKQLPDDTFDSIAGFLKPFFTVLDPLSEVSLLGNFRRFQIRAAQEIASLFLFGRCEAGTECPDLPSRTNEVIGLQKTRDGKMYLKSGCDSNFEGEILFTMFAFDLIETMIDTVMDIVPTEEVALGGSFIAHAEGGLKLNSIGLITVPIRATFQYVKHIQSKLADTCDFLDGYVGFAKTEATLENTRWALRELACVPVAESKKYHGCDGIDNNCDDQKLVDECDEDQSPPEILPLVLPSTKFDSIAAAEDYIRSNLRAVDDCLQDIEILTTSQPTGTTTSGPTYTIFATAIAKGCGERMVDQAEVTFENVGVRDSAAPTVECTLGVSGLKGKGAGVYENAELSISATDDFASVLQYKLTVSSNEVDADDLNMVILSNAAHPELFIRDFTCPTGNNGGCKISAGGGGKNRSRTYQVLVEATDEGGNTGSATCQTVVGGSDAGGPFFDIESTSYNL